MITIISAVGVCSVTPRAQSQGCLLLGTWPPLRTPGHSGLRGCCSVSQTMRGSWVWAQTPSSGCHTPSFSPNTTQVSQVRENRLKDVGTKEWRLRRESLSAQHFQIKTWRDKGGTEGAKLKIFTLGSLEMPVLHLYRPENAFLKVIPLAPHSQRNSHSLGYT